MKTKVWRKGLSILFGTFLALAVLEGALRVAAWAWARGAHRAAAGSQAARPPFRILCLGESTTARTDFLPGRADVSWPRQLEDILNAAAGARAYEVINGAFPGIDTGILVSGLPAALDRLHPDLVVAMMGFNDDRWYGIVEFKNGWRGRARRFLWKLKVVKLFRYIGHEFLGPVMSRAPAPALAGRPAVYRGYGVDPGDPASKRCGEEYGRALGPGPFSRWEADCVEAIRGRPQDLSLLAFVIHGYFDLGRRDAAVKLSPRYVDRGGPDNWPYTILIGAYARENRMADAEAVFRKARAAVPSDTLPPVSIAMAQAYMDHGRDEEAARLYREAAGLWGGADRSPDVAVRKASGSAPKDSATALNYRTALRLLKERRVPLVVMQYPTLDVARERELFDDPSGVLFVSNKENFARALSRGTYAEYFVDRIGGGWGHCTAEGNRLIAEHLARELREHGWLERAPAGGFR